MDLNKIKPVSDPVYLAEVYPPFKTYEGKARKTWAWVTVRKAIEADNLRRAKYLETSTLRYRANESSGVIVESTQGGDIHERVVMEVYWTLEAVGNLTRDDQPVFPVLPVRGMEVAVFIDLWNSLPIDVTAAIYAATLTVNPSWLDD